MPHSRSLTSTVLAVSMIFAAPLGAQIIRVERTATPVGWITGSIGLFQPRSVTDGTTNSVWAFGNTVQWRAGVEFSIDNGSSVGVAGTYADVPLTYYDAGQAAGGACGTNAGCDAHATLWSAMAMFRIGGGRGFHQIIEFGGGVMGYQDFTLDDVNERVGPPGTDLDFAFSVGYGFGYTMSPRFHIALVQDYAAVLHQRENLPGGTSSLAQHYTTRLALRYGLGSRSRL